MRTGARRSVILPVGPACLIAVWIGLSGCGPAGSFKVPSIPSFGSGSASGDAATFVIDGGTISVVQSGSISVHIGGVPQMDYSGPLGCRGRYFTADYSEHIRILFHYSAREAYLLLGQDLYRFAGRPRVRGGRLRWAHRFADRRLAVSVACPPPPARSTLRR